MYVSLQWRSVLGSEERQPCRGMISGQETRQEVTVVNWSEQWHRGEVKGLGIDCPGSAFQLCPLLAV